MASTYPYTQLMARDTNDNPISVELHISSDSAATDESDVVAAVRAYLDELPGVHVSDVTRYALTETPLP